MGDRRMAEIRTEGGSLYLYVHWHGHALPTMARKAVERAKVRLHDYPYWTRIVIDELTRDGRDKETGFGLMLKPDAEDEYNHDRPSVIIDAKDGSVRVIGKDGETGGDK